MDRGQEQGLEPTALRRAREHTHAGCQLGGRALTPLETGVAADVSLINAAHTDLAVFVLKLSSTREEDDRRRSVVIAESKAGLAAATVLLLLLLLPKPQTQVIIKVQKSSKCLKTEAKKL